MSFLHPPSGSRYSRRRCQNGPNGTKSHKTSVSPYGRVFLTSIDWIPSQKADRAWLAPRLNASDRIAAACDGRLLTPA